MSRLLAMSSSLAVALGVVAATHYYLWLRLVRDMAWSPPLLQSLTLLVALLGLSIPLTLLLVRLLSLPQARLLAWITYVWMGLFFMLLSLSLGGDLLRGAAGLLRQWGGMPPLDVQRRLFLTRLSGSGVLLSGLLASGLAMRNALRGPQITPVRVGLARWPQALPEFRIVQISDLHVAPLLGRAYVEHVVAQVQQQQPDMVVLTGDLVDGSVAELAAGVAPLRQLRAPHGVYMVTGNHEYYSGADAWIAEFRRLGISVLRNERVCIGKVDGTPAECFDLAGIDDYTAHHFGNGHGADLPRAVAGRDTRRELVLLAHQPRVVDEAAAHGVGLMLAGHTHGGQIWPFGYLVKLVQPYLAGLARHKPSMTQIYVNRGTGYWGPPMRLGAMPEITVLTLHRST